ncbi:MAG: hypothetical protein H8D94_00045 [Candidatus Pelagibacter sp.]|nr:hypothetical protein [Candidatus Pelagibacter sp.]
MNKNYETHNTIDIETIGTHLQGYINTDYNRLVELFGKPSEFIDGYKTDVEWAIKFEDGTISTIYNWKNGKNYLGNDGLNVSDMDEFNVGGFDINSLINIKDLIENGL